MSSVYISYPNLIDSAASIYGGSWGGTLARIGTRKFGEVARTVGTSSVASVIVVDLGAAKTIAVVALAAHNLSAAAQWRLKLGTSVPGGTDAHDSGEQPCWSITPGPGYCVLYSLPTAVTARYLRIEISDELNPAGAIEIGRAFVGGKFQPALDAQRGGFAAQVDDKSEVVAMDNDAETFAVRRKVRSHSFTLQAATDEEGDSAHELMMSAGLTGEVFFCPFPSDPARAQRYGFIGRMRQLSPVEWPYKGYRSLAFSVKESI